eukprot:9001515-Lingulodinium_polyedra.AAC.1
MLWPANAAPRDAANAAAAGDEAGGPRRGSSSDPELCAGWVAGATGAVGAPLGAIATPPGLEGGAGRQRR